MFSVAINTLSVVHLMAPSFSHSYVLLSQGQLGAYQHYCLSRSVCQFSYSFTSKLLLECYSPIIDSLLQLLCCAPPLMLQISLFPTNRCKTTEFIRHIIE